MSPGKEMKSLGPITPRTRERSALNLPAGLGRMGGRERAWWFEAEGRVVGGQPHLARETRMRQPPENFCVGRFCISGSKPRPARIRRALASAAAAPVARSSSYTWERTKRSRAKVTGTLRAQPVSLPSPLPSPAAQPLYRLPAPAAPEAVAPPPAALIAWCRLEEQPALLAFHPLPPLGVGRAVRPPRGQDPIPPALQHHFWFA